MLLPNEGSRGNPAAVCPLSEAADDSWMQSVAAEMNLSETAFFWPEADGFRLRWFTPTVEVDLCGHATLASAHILWEVGGLATTEMARFHTKSGLLTAQRINSAIELDFPAKRLEAIAPPDGLFEALGAAGRYVGKEHVRLPHRVGFRICGPFSQAGLCAPKELSCSRSDRDCKIGGSAVRFRFAFLRSCCGCE